ncbi:MAG: hypothetical protein J1E35_02425 [Lachnospiraceae bacterium]|nr:hypothetical protein [Lachnospiraceae bacterium]
MNNLYTEANVKKKVTTKDTMIKFAVIAAVAAVFVVGVLGLNMMLILFGIIGGVCAFTFLPRLSVVYEYIFCDGQLDFDKIMAGEKRKHLYRLDFDNVVIMAPANSHALDSYRQNDSKVLDFSSLEEGHKVFGIVESAGEKQTLIYFEPDEKMISYIKQKAPRKLSEY